MSELIIREIIHNIGKSSQIIIDNFDKLLEPTQNIYHVLEKIPHYKKVLYILLSCIIIFVITKYDIKLNLLFSMFVSVIVIYYFISRDDILEQKFLDDKQIQLKFLHNLLFYERDKYVTSVINDNFNIVPPLNNHICI